MNWVVRAGVARAQALINGYARHVRVPGLYGFSVRFNPGKSVDELARAGRFPHSQISYASDDALHAALTSLGYTMQLVKSPGVGYHHTFVVLYDNTGTMLRSLPPDAARALSRTFRQQPNPARIP